MAGNKVKTGKTAVKRMLLIVSVAFVVGIAFSSLFELVVTSTNDTEFCSGCHSMQWSYAQLKASTHWKNSSGIHAGCADCHVPKEFWPRLKTKISATKDLWHEIAGTINTQEKFDARQLQMAERVWQQMRETDSRECRNCHLFQHMDIGKQSDAARKDHQNDTGKTCIDCHKGIAHKLPQTPNGDVAATK
jgi:cytochrome c-type protein NapC